MLVLDKVFIHTVKTKTSYMPELYVNNMGDIKSEILPAEYGLFGLKIQL